LSYGENKQLGRLGALAQQIICFTITSGAPKVPTNQPPAPLTGQEERIALARHFVGFHNGFGIILKLVYRLAYNGDVVAFKMGRRQGGPSRTGSRGRISQSIRNRRATQPPAYFQRNPPGRGRLAVFPPPRRIDRMNPDMGALPPVRLGPPRKTAN
jgi:hypothetical protein